MGHYASKIAEKSSAVDKRDECRNQIIIVWEGQPFPPCHA